VMFLLLYDRGSRQELIKAHKQTSPAHAGLVEDKSNSVESTTYLGHPKKK